MSRSQYVLLLHLSIAFAVCPLNAQTPGGLIRRTPENVDKTRRAERPVTLDVQVTDRLGKPLNGLTQQDITLLDDGRPETSTSFQRMPGNDEAPPVGVVIVVDTMNASFQDVVIEREGIEKCLTQNGGHLAFRFRLSFSPTLE